MYVLKFDTIQYPFTHNSCYSFCSALSYGSLARWSGFYETLSMEPPHLREFA